MSSQFNNAILVAGKVDNHAHQAILSGLHEAFLHLGYTSHLFALNLDGSDVGGFIETVEQAVAENRENTFLLDINGRMQLPLTQGLKKISVYIDHPCEHLERLDAQGPADIITYLDPSHLLALEALGFRQQKVLLPHGGPEPLQTPPFDARDIDLLFSGRLEGSPRFDDLRQGLADNPPIVRDIVLQTTERVMAGEFLFEAFGAACETQSVHYTDFDRDGLRMAIVVADKFVRAHERHQLLTSIKTRPIHLIGQVDGGFFDKAPDNIIFLGPKSFAEFEAFLLRTKILLNTAHVSPGGTHERVWYGMAAGCVVATDPGPLIEADFTHGKHLLLWPRDPAKIDAMLTEVLETPGRAQTIVEAATPIYKKSHTWRVRAKTLIAALSG